MKLGYTYRYARSRNFSFWYYDCKNNTFFLQKDILSFKIILYNCSL